MRLIPEFSSKVKSRSIRAPAESQLNHPPIFDFPSSHFRFVSGFDEAEASAGRKTITLQVFVGDAPHGTAGRREHKLFDRNAKKPDSR